MALCQSKATLPICTLLKRQKFCECKTTECPIWNPTNVNGYYGGYFLLSGIFPFIIMVQIPIWLYTLCVHFDIWNIKIFQLFKGSPLYNWCPIFTFFNFHPQNLKKKSHKKFECNLANCFTSHFSLLFSRAAISRNKLHTFSLPLHL